MTNGANTYFSSTLEKGLIILNLFDRDHSSRRLSEISKITGINKTSVYRYVNTLVRMGYLRKSENNRLLRLGPKAFVLGHHFFHGFDIFQSVKPIIDKTFLDYKVSIDSALLHEHVLISLYRRELPNLIYFRLPVIMEDLYARAMGKAVLAKLDPAELVRIIADTQIKRLTSHTLSSKKKILNDIELTRARGYSINNEEYIEGLICIGAPIMNYREKSIVGAVSLDFPASDYSLDAIQKHYPGILTKLANEVSEAVTATEA